MPENLRPIPATYSLNDQSVTEMVLPHLVDMLDAALAEGHMLVVVSSYRSYEQQEGIYQYHVNTYGIDEASRVSARAGHSEHQLGTTVDFSSAAVGFELVEAFGQTPEGRWLAANAHKYGFVLSYPEGKEAITGYAYEPWHFRWVGKDVAPQVLASALTLGEFLRRR